MNDPESNPLRDHLNRLPREISPSRDLWPGIQARIEPSAHQPVVPPMRRYRLPLAIAAALVLAATLPWMRPDGWVVEVLAGTPLVDRTGIAGPSRLAVGEWLETDASSRARLTVGKIGEVSIEPNSRLRLVSTAANDHRVELERGRMSALIWAPPRLFFVETPAATAIDLGCAYTLTVDDRGVGLLEVTSGYVALEHRGLESIVPAGLACLTHPGFGPGTPFSVESSTDFRAALNRFDAGDRAIMHKMLAAADTVDRVSLWHVLARAPAADRGGVFDKLAALQAPPEGVTREGIIAGDSAMRNRWALSLGLWPLGTKKKI